MIYDDFANQVIGPLEKFLDTMAKININNKIYLETKPNNEDRVALEIDEEISMRDYILEMCYRMVITGFSSIYDCFSFIVEFIEQFRPIYINRQEEDPVEFYSKNNENVADFTVHSFSKIKEELNTSLNKLDQFTTKYKR